MIVLDATLKQTPLHARHLQLKAKMVPFGGWDMPVQYAGGILEEYTSTRRNVSVFDTSHMGEFFLTGDAVASGLDKLVTQKLTDMPVKTCRYGAMLNDEGGVIDDLIVYRLDGQEWMVVVNGGTMQKDEGHFKEHLTAGQFVNRSFELGKLDIQGPQSRKILSSFINKIEKLSYYTFDTFEVLGEQVIVSRTGYTGELGYEIYFPWDKVSVLWDKLLALGVKPAGLGVRDLLRIEMGYSLYGHELAEDISPLTAGLNPFIAWDKEFIGRASLLREKERGIARKVACFVCDTRQSPRSGFVIFNEQDQEVGVVTSGTFSPSLSRGIGLGFMDKDAARPGNKIFVGKEQQRIPAVTSPRPIYQQGSLKS